MQGKYTFQQISGGYLIPIIVVLVALGIYFLIIPKYKDLGTQRALLQSKITEVEDKENNLEDVQLLLKNYEQNKEKLTELEAAIPAAPRLPELLANFDHLIGISGVQISDMQIEQINSDQVGAAPSPGSGSQIPKLQTIASSGADIKVLQITMSLSGDYSAIKAFLENIQNNKRLMDISEIALGEPDEENNQQEFVVKIQTYYQLASQ